MIRRALSVLPGGELSDPDALIEVAVAAEAHGWDAVFLWDHLLRPSGEAAGLLDPWVMLGVMARATTRIRLGPNVTPVPRRRPLKLAREAATLDLVAGGRLILGLGLGVDHGGEFTRTEEELDPKVQGSMLEEGVVLLDRLLRGEQVHHRGRHYTADGVTVEPIGVQRPRVPFWLAARGHALAPVRRAARYEGVSLLENTPERVGEIVEVVQKERGTLAGFDVIVVPIRGYAVEEYERRGATWIMHLMRPPTSVEEIMRVVRTAH